MNKKQKKVHSDVVLKSKALKYSPTGIYNKNRLKNLENEQNNTNIKQREEYNCASCTTQTAGESI